MSSMSHALSNRIGIDPLGTRYNTHTRQTEEADCSILTSPLLGCIATVYNATHHFQGG